ncbi:hypothetical protein BLOT_004094 [Blomia tropicalis]|nr:hypothetical protein BLOT_004094 [Blomia tropicalis]
MELDIRAALVQIEPNMVEDDIDQENRIRIRDFHIHMIFINAHILITNRINEAIQFPFDIFIRGSSSSLPLLVDDHIPSVKVGRIYFEHHYVNVQGAIGLVTLVNESGHWLVSSLIISTGIAFQMWFYVSTKPVEQLNIQN